MSSKRVCRWHTCEIPIEDDKDFCPGHWKQIPLDIRGELLVNPKSMGRDTDLRRASLTRALAAIRKTGAT